MSSPLNPVSPEVQLAKFAFVPFSESSTIKFLPKLKIKNLKEYNEVAKRVKDVVEPLRKEIAGRNATKPLYIRILDAILSLVTLGYIRLCEREIDSKIVNQTMNKIRNVIQQTPLHKQTWRTNHSFLPNAATALQKKWKERLDRKYEGQFKNKTVEHRNLALLKKNWIENHQHENARILKSGILTPTNLGIINGLVTNASTKDPKAKKLQLMTVIGRALELKKFYSKTHYIFTHGQSLGLSVINECMHELVRMFDPSNYQLFVNPLRIPGSVPHVDDVDQFAKKYTIDGHFVDDHHNDEIISCDSYFWSTHPSESALYCFAAQWNMTSDANYIKIFNHYVKDNYLACLLAARAVKVAKEKAALSEVGTLNLICIPRETVEAAKTYVYPSKAYGIRQSKGSKQADIEALRKMQEDDSLNGAYTQYRILAAPLSKDKNIRAFALNSLTAMENQDYHHKVMLLVNETALYVALQKHSTKSSEAEIDHIVKLVTWIQEWSHPIDPKAISHILKSKKDIHPTVDAIFAGMIGAGSV